MARTSKILAAAAFTALSAGAANASVVETAIALGTTPSTWIAAIVISALIGLAAGGTQPDGRTARKTAPANSAHTPAGWAAALNRDSGKRRTALARIGQPNQSPARAVAGLAA